LKVENSAIAPRRIPRRNQNDGMLLETNQRKFTLCCISTVEL